MAAVPPVSVKVCVVAAGAGGGGDAVEAVVDGGVVGDDVADVCDVRVVDDLVDDLVDDDVADEVVGVGCTAGAVVGLDEGRFADEVLEEAAEDWARVGTELGSSTVVEADGWLLPVESLTAEVGVVVGEANSVADGGSTTWLSTTDTPAQATPTAAALATSHIENSMKVFMESVSPLGSRRRVNATLNEP